LAAAAVVPVAALADTGLGGDGGETWLWLWLLCADEVGDLEAAVVSAAAAVGEDGVAKRRGDAGVGE